jgi:GTP-binding protein
MFVDRIKVFAQAGSGGRGAVSFRREKFVPKGGPDGGDGGRGGDIILKADSHVDNLSSLFYEPIIKAKNGGHGMGKKMYGRAAPNKIVKVPVGTMVYRADGGGNAERPTPNVQRRIGEGQDEAANAQRPKPNVQRSMEEEEEERPGAIHAAPAFTAEGIAAVVGQAPRLPREPTIRDPQPAIELLADLTEDGQEFLLAKGGGGGKGNVHFKSSRNRAPRQYTEGEEGEQGHFLFELRTIADAGLVGYPNAGKSTLLRTISAARPKVAAYPFTTLHPIVGIVEFSGYRRATIADIPGLIEGAHRNVGLGHDFLRHITRCRVLVFVLDIAGSEARSPIEDLQQLRKEIDHYDPTLSQRPWFVVANKMDLPEANENLTQLRARFPKTDVVPISAANREGIDELKEKLSEALL